MGCRVFKRGIKFMFSKKATKFEKIFTIDLTSCSKCQIDGEDFVNFCGLLRKHELYKINIVASRQKLDIILENKAFKIDVFK